MTAAGEQSPRSRLIGRIVLVALILALPWILGIYLTNIVDQIGIFILMGLGLNIVVGFAGLLDLGYVAFFAIGAYTMGLLTSTGDLGLGLPFWLALPVSLLAAATMGILLGVPVLRMRGDYLAIVTLGFGEIIRVLAASDLLKPIIGGAQGIIKIGSPKIFGFVFVQPQHYYYLILAGCILAIFVSSRLRDAKLGRQWMALREDEDVAEAMGINLVKTKLLAFSIGAAFGGLAGGIFASRLNSIFPNSFALLISINVLSLIIVGGIGSLPGVVLGAAVLVGLPLLLSEFNQYQILIYGAVLVATMILRPEGLWPSPIRKRELHADEEIAMREGPLHEDVHDLV
ncbi:MAG: branched-chain amino acid ABC transporter permease [Chloroflexota bacterium]|nr:MAG: branched-chain amino acid ABC transporter permease [Chloroflexota bacterium]